MELYKPFFKLGSPIRATAGHEKGLVVMGDQDHIFFRAAERFTQLQRNMRLSVIENCGHVCSIEAPELFNEFVLNFLQDADVPRRVTATPVPKCRATKA